MTVCSTPLPPASSVVCTQTPKIGGTLGTKVLRPEVIRVFPLAVEKSLPDNPGLFLPYCMLLD